MITRIPIPNLIGYVKNALLEENLIDFMSVKVKRWSHIRGLFRKERTKINSKKGIIINKWQINY